MCSWRRHHPFRLVFTTGDNVYPYGERARFGPAFFDPFRCLRRDLGHIPRVARKSRLVHERRTSRVEQPTSGMPSGRNYVVRRGGVRFVIADSTALHSRPVANPLCARIRATVGRSSSSITRSSLRGRVIVPRPASVPAYRHVPAPGGGPRAARPRSHLHAASKPLHRIRYVVTGGGGAPLYGCRPAWYVEQVASSAIISYTSSLAASA